MLPSAILVIFIAAFTRQVASITGKSLPYLATDRSRQQPRDPPNPSLTERVAWNCTDTYSETPKMAYKCIVDTCTPVCAKFEEAPDYMDSRDTQGCNCDKLKSGHYDYLNRYEDQSDVNTDDAPPTADTDTMDGVGTGVPADSAAPEVQPSW